eukprot:CAMPEP_0113648640 /NCGR_PEP_ID=MMETSP0017_2-20120614/25809_1 /TAXON_ID=2856 /ORGANISM="Cylindrotheca closterium" /LENGTH=46 /DNA_ID=CAMNT_0000560891 /DNA_START=17 /DNA_END=153 /DNA_ORIENTATION=- /assembly_acc=CAM_ASM_000147
MKDMSVTEETSHCEMSSSKEERSLKRLFMLVTLGPKHQLPIDPYWA